MDHKAESVTSLPANIQWLPLASNNGSLLFFLPPRHSYGQHHQSCLLRCRDSQSEGGRS